jgi:hypothetical protein
MIKITNRTDLMNHLIERYEDLVDLSILHSNLGNHELSWDYGKRAKEVYSEFMRLYNM